jgi:hypothetical protein
LRKDLDAFFKATVGTWFKHGGLRQSLSQNVDTPDVESDIQGSGKWEAPYHFLAQSVIDQMVHHGLYVRGGNAVPGCPLLCEIGYASAVSANIVSELLNYLPYALNRFERSALGVQGPTARYFW